MKPTAEQQARDLLERLGVENAQSFSSGDLVEIANLIVRAKRAPLQESAPVQEERCAKCGHVQNDHDGYGGMCDGLGANEFREVYGCLQFVSPVVAESSTAAAGEGEGCARGHDGTTEPCWRVGAGGCDDWQCPEHIPQEIAAAAIRRLRTPPASTQTDGTFKELLDTFKTAFKAFNAFYPEPAPYEVWKKYDDARAALLAHVARLEAQNRALECELTNWIPRAQIDSLMEAHNEGGA